MIYHHLLNPKATAVWLVDNTTLTFDQIAQFCTLHPLEVKAIADGEAAVGVRGIDPIVTGQLSREDITKSEKTSSVPLKLLPPKVKVPEMKKRKGPRYTPLSRRQDRPNAILWLVKNHPEMPDAAISRLVGTTKNTIDSIRGRTHWNSQTLTPIDPVALSLCSQMDLDFEVGRSAKYKTKTNEAHTLTPTAQVMTPASFEPFEKKSKETPKVDDVFANFASLKPKE
jgi:uncharacterized protein